ncbi:GlcNAc-PI de-N-acetylase [Fulvitalea axinellae]|uniref:GlcNAc-PI de-N-acetylase n=1 Tax=Fulvitalea axinellae TaxID=1182444 RepID=A0AAU9CHD5_9BACT|nr:GlcNAc-PI de-N-acetylase [Fulvitalea axinellae]
MSKRGSSAVLIALSLLFPLCLKAQQRNSAEILLELKKLNVLGSVMYIAAHPDDENTRFIAWSANDRKYRTAYLSLTRGDGGQNLIGTEKGPKGVGIIRTQELLEARRTDGGEQYFTRAVDFGYSKSADETFGFWDKDKILADVVWNIRRFQPDVIVTRFPPDKRAGHGHHTASAILAEEAFKLAADKNAFPEQLDKVSVWQTKRLFHNMSTWWDKTLPEKVKNSPEKFCAVDIGTYNALLGKSHNEIASLSRSQHRSQGFGASLSRGSQTEYLQLKLGEAYSSDFMDGVSTTWARTGDSKIQKQIEKIISDFNSEKPYVSVDALFKLRERVQKAEKSVWTDHKTAKINELISDCLGVYAVAKPKNATVLAGSDIDASLEIIQRSPLQVKLESVVADGKDLGLKTTLSPNIFEKKNISLSTAQKNSQPYWLAKPYEYTYDVNNQQLIGRPENPELFDITANLAINGYDLPVKVPLRYMSANPVLGELSSKLTISDGASISFGKSVYIFGEKGLDVKVTVESFDENGLEGTLALDLPSEWASEPASIQISDLKKGKAKTFSFFVKPSEKATLATPKAMIKSRGKTMDKKMLTIDYPHISKQTLFESAESRFVHLPVKNNVKRVAYISGAGDEIPQALSAIGIEVTELSAESLGAVPLDGFEAIIVGIRAYNINEALAARNGSLLEYVKNGGNLIVQYNTAHRLKTKEIGPFPFTISRERVTEEDAEVKFLRPDHPALNTPNKLTPEDFDGWVQERGLYFANKWDGAFTPILSWHDKGEPARDGSLIVSHYGKGTFTYTGISFFRQLPAGVPGAYRLFVNLLNMKNHGKNS